MFGQLRWEGVPSASRALQGDEGHKTPARAISRLVHRGTFFLRQHACLPRQFEIRVLDNFIGYCNMGTISDVRHWGIFGEFLKVFVSLSLACIAPRQESLKE